ncbi:MAG: SH3 domain-containing protein [Chloroflexi bacterium]|nr:SH3 domain-containing protein [Chloroflexota bacterium]
MKHDHHNTTTRFLPLGLALFAILTMSVSAGAVLADSQPQPPDQTVPTATSDEVQFPTATATPIGAATATPTRTPTITPTLARLIGDPVTNLRSGPGIDTAIVAELPQGTELPLIGREIVFDNWYVVEWAEAPEGQAWVFKALVVVVGDILTVPVVPIPEVPTVDPAQADAQATQSVLFQTPGAEGTATAEAVFQPTGVATRVPSTQVAEGGPLPTFTAPAPYATIAPDAFAAPPPEEPSGGVAPAVLILSLAGMGVLTILVGIVRRLIV